MESRELTPARWRSSRPICRSAASFAVAVVIGLLLIVFGGYLDRHAVARSEPPAARSLIGEHPSVVGSASDVATLGFSIPTSVRIPALGLHTDLIRLGRNPDGTVQVPSNPQLAGWYDGGPTPGQVGSAVLLGHVDSYLGPAAFFDLRKIKAGNIIEVTRSDGAVARFAVTGLAMYPKDHFPAQQVYGPHGGSTLQLVTCGGRFDHVTRSYESNLVVYTRLVGSG